MTNKTASDLKLDTALIRGTLTGDSQAFEELVKKYWNQVYYLALKYCRCSETASDIAQETFIAVFESLETFVIGKKFRPWLLKITANKAIKHFNKSSKLPTSELHDCHSDNNTPEQIFEKRQIFDQCLLKLEFEQRILFVLRHGLQLSYDEMATILDKPVGSVKGELFRARRQLKQHFSKTAQKQGEV